MFNILAHKKKQGEPKDAKRGGRGAELMAQMGLNPTSMSDMEAAIYGDLENDEDLEAELAMLQGHDPPPKKAKTKQASPVSLAHIEQMAAESTRDIPSDDELDENDPDLLAELQDLAVDEEEDAHSSPPPSKTSDATSNSNMTSVLEERLQNYNTAIENAKAANDSSKIRRLERGVKTLQGLLKSSRAGKPISEDEIPPPCAVGGARPKEVTQPAPYIQPTTDTPQPPLPTSQPQENTPYFHPTTGDSQTASQPMAHQTNEKDVSSSSRGLHQYKSPLDGTVTDHVAVKNHTIAWDNVKILDNESDRFKIWVKESIWIRRERPGMNQDEGGFQLPHVYDDLITTAPSSDEATRQMLTTRMDAYKHAALAAKHAGDLETAKKYVRVSKQFDMVIQALDEGKPVDLSKMPPPPPTSSQGPSPGNAKVERDAHQAQPPPEAEPELPVPSQEEAKEMFHAPEAPKTVMEALLQRLDKYKSAVDSAKGEGNNSKARRMGRIVKQYEDAIKATKAGKAVDYGELPSPPGFAPIPANTVAPAPAAKPTPVPRAAASQAPAPATAPAAQTSTNQTAPTRPVSTASSGSDTSIKRGRTSSRESKQLDFLLGRQKAFKLAALEAKNNGDIQLAKQYLTTAKGFNRMIEATKCGLPVDLTTLPPPPHSDELSSFEVIERDDDSEKPTGDRGEMYKRLETDLIEQIRRCGANAQHFTSLGDVSTAAKFDKMGKDARKDLDALKNAFKHGDPVPRFHYETRTHAMVQSCTDLGDGDLELIIIRGLNYPLPSGYAPKDLDTYVKYEFPFPTDKPQEDTCDTCKGTENPEYNNNFKIQIDRKSRGFLRVVKNKAIKFEIFYKRGFLKSDKPLGTVTVKLHSLESQCILHESVDLMEGRKRVGGKLEIKIRIREPLTSKQVEEVKEKWLVIDHFERHLAPPVQSRARSPGGPAVRGGAQVSGAPVMSMEVMRYEKELLDRQISTFKREGRLNPSQEQALRQKSQQIQQRIENQQAQLQQGGIAALKAYGSAISKTIPLYHQEAQQLGQRGQRDKVQVALTKKKCVEREVQMITTRLAKA